MKKLSNYILLLLACLFFGQYSTAATPTFRITVIFRQPVEEDSLFLSLNTSFFNDNNGEEKIYGAHSDGHGKYIFAIDTHVAYGNFSILQKPSVSSPFKGKQRFIPFLYGYLWEAGDDVTITVTRRRPLEKLIGLPDYDYRQKHTGTGAAKYTVKDELDSARKTDYGYERSFFTDTTNTSYHESYFYQINACLQVLDKARGTIPDFYYQLFRAETITLSYGISSYFFRLKERYDQISGNKMAREHFLDAYNRAMANRHSIRVSPDVLLKSSDYIAWMYQKINFENYLLHGQESTDANFKTISTAFTGELRDKIFVKALMKDQGSEHFDTLYQYAASLIKDSVSLRIMKQLRSRIPGLAAYNFKLMDTGGKYHQLSDYKGKVVFIDMWFTGCGACAAIYEDVVKQAEEELKDNPDIKFLSICVDTGKNVWMESIKSGEYTSDLITNLYTNGEGFKHEMMEYYSINSLPKLMIVRPDGKVHRFYHNRLAKDLESTETLIETLKAAVKL